MELELWTELSQAICDVQWKFKFNPRDIHRTALIVRVHLWATLHDRPTVWGCDHKNWTRKTCPEKLPDQSTMSRRMQTRRFPYLPPGRAAATQRQRSRPSSQNRRWQTAGTSQPHRRSRRRLGTGRFASERRIQAAHDLLGKSNARRVCDHGTGRLREADGPSDDQASERLRLSAGRWTLRCELALRCLQISRSRAGESANQARHRHWAPLSIASAFAFDSTAGAACQRQRVWAVALREANRNRTAVQPIDLFRRRAGCFTFMGPPHLESAKLGLGQAADQRRAYPNPKDLRGMMHNPYKAREKGGRCDCPGLITANQFKLGKL